jgi:hypothetical protein
MRVSWLEVVFSLNSLGNTEKVVLFVLCGEAEQNEQHNYFSK